MILKAVLLDLDGVVYRGSELVPEADRLIAWVRQQGLGVAFLTNRSGQEIEHIQRHLQGLGVDCEPGEILTSALATAHYLDQAGAERVFVLGGPGLTQVLREGSISLVDENADHVVIGGTADLTFADITKATQLVLQGAELVATNTDRLVDSESGPVPGNGATVAAVAFATRMEPVVVGKPERYLVDMALDRLGVSPQEAILVGDSRETDIRAGRRAGIRTVLIRTGVGSRSSPEGLEETPDFEVEDHRALKELLAKLV